MEMHRPITAAKNQPTPASLVSALLQRSLRKKMLKTCSVAAPGTNRDSQRVDARFCVGPRAHALKRAGGALMVRREQRRVL